LSYEELIVKAKKMLCPSGRLVVVLPFEEGNYFESLAKDSGLHVIRQLAFYSRQGKPQERWLFEFALAPKELSTETLILHGKGEGWSDDYKTLTKDFYLKL
jgi:tRNA1Val (adenine37-N6)-methyltransferase